MRNILDIVDAHETLLEIADFFHALEHKTEEVPQGTNIKELARVLGITVPPSLQEGTISVIERHENVARGRTILVQYGEPGPAGGVTPKKGGGHCYKFCHKVGPGNVCIEVCVDCSLAKLSCTVSVNVTIEIKL
jgi:hypothetical protein